MSEKQKHIKSFTDLNAWKKGHNLALCLYKKTKNFPEEERFGLTNQLRRAAVSVPSNIAEGFSRPSYKDKQKFFYTALGSLSEVQSQLLLARDLGYLTTENFRELADRTIETSKLINGLIKGVKEKT